MNPQQSSIDLYLQALSQLKKKEICELAAQQNLDLSGKKSEVISRLCDKFRSSQKPEVVKGQEDDDSDEEDAFLDASDIVENELEEIKSRKNSPCEIIVKKESTGAKRENFKNALEFVPEFDPDLMEFEFWKNSIKAATDCYQIVESDRKLIVHRKIMGRAKTWLQSDHANLFLSSDALLDKMAALFSLAVRKSDSRRRLQERKWSSIEPFTKYCQEKIILANKLKLENEELVDEIIAGVGDVQLEDHLRMMNFADPMAMMAACKDVKKRKTSAPFRNNGPRLCFQCNSPNHVFSACPEKPKPKMGVGRSPAGAEYVKREKSSQLHHHQGASDRHQNIHCLSFGMQRYITGSWGTTNFNLNTRIYLRNEINVLTSNNVVEKLEAENQKQITNNKRTIREKVCNPISSIVHRDEGLILDEWILQGVVVVTRHGDRGPMVHVRDVDTGVDCGVRTNDLQLSRYRSFLMNSTVNASLAHMSWLKSGPFHGFPLLPATPRGCLLGQLTYQGIAQHLQLGEILKKVYGYALGLSHKIRYPDSVGFSPNPTYPVNTDNIVIYSTRYRRTFQSAMALMFSILPVEKWISLNIRESHSLSFCFSDCACQKADLLRGNFKKLVEMVDPEMENLLSWMGDKLIQSASEKHSAMEIRDAILTFLCHDARMPCPREASKSKQNNSITPQDLDVINIDQELVSQQNFLEMSEDKVVEDENDDGNSQLGKRFDSPEEDCIQGSHVEAVLEHTAQQDSKEVKNIQAKQSNLLRAYGLLRNIVNFILKMVSGDNVKFVLYSGHDRTIQYLLTALGLSNTNRMFVAYASRAIFEIYKSGNGVPEFYFRVVYNGEDVTSSIPFCEGGRSLRVARGIRSTRPADLCPIENIIRYIHDDYFQALNATNYKDACATQKIYEF